MAFYECIMCGNLPNINFKTSDTKTFSAEIGKKYVVVSIGNGQSSEFKTLTVTGARVLNTMSKNLVSTGANSMQFQANIAVVEATSETIEANVKSSYDTNGFVKLIYFEI